MNASAPFASPLPSGANALESLPFSNSFARLPANFHSRLDPTPLPDPYPICVSANAAALIGLDGSALRGADFAEYFIGNRWLPGSEPLAAVYSGHQFGQWAGQLGDGRAHLLGGIRGPDALWEIQLKGSGRTPYARGADGRAVLRSSIREFLCSEAMAALGVPTTRALCVIGSDAPIQRECWETAAVVARMAPSFLRFGSFEHWGARKKQEELRRLTDYFIDHLRPELRDSAKPVEALLADVARRTGELMAHWMAVGFMHGVMNTDNMSMLGLTLDYGPFGFMEAFDSGHICNHSDHQGRYAYRAQPRVAQWNLQALAFAMASLVGDAETAQGIVDQAFADTYNTAFTTRLMAKLGFTSHQDGDEDFIGETFGLLQRHRPDFTLFFRSLSTLPTRPSEADRRQLDAPVRNHFPDRDACDAWLAKWRERLALEESQDAPRQAAMLKTNPKYVLRNWMAEGAIRRAQEKDFSEVERVLDCLKQPFDEQPQYQSYAALPPDWAGNICVSCSS